MSARTRDRSGRRVPLRAGEHLRAELKRLGLNQSDVSKAAGVTRQTVNNIVNGRQPISRAMAAKLGRLTGRASDYWLQETFAAARASSSHSAARGGILVDHQIVRAIKDGVIDVSRFDESRVHAASLELTLGAGSARGVRIARGRSVRVVTGERIAFPHDHLGRIGAAPHLARLGAIAAYALHVAPGFSGKLEICIFNAGERDLVLKAGDPIVSLEIVPLPTPPALAGGFVRRRKRQLTKS
ncbi:MAG: dCTP deaminase domain-containing protein [Pseudolabrys sp.]